MRNLYTACGCVVVLAACASVFGQSVVLPPAPAGVEVTREQGIEFVTVRGGGSGIPYQWPPEQRYIDVHGRGVVPTDFRIARTEVSSGQWAEFLNTFSGQVIPAEIRPHIGLFARIGPEPSSLRALDWQPGDTFGRFQIASEVPNAAMLPAGGVSWRVAAIYCNWLHNGRSSDPRSLVDGAYNTRTWSTSVSDFFYSDEISRQAGARFMLPSLDQWLKATYYDPNRHGQGQGGWWQRVNSTDALPVIGLPGQVDAQGRLATTTYGIQGANGEIDNSVWLVPLAGYEYAQSPWGLFDTIGGTSELLADPWLAPGEVLIRGRLIAGTPAQYTLFPSYRDEAIAFGSHVLGPYGVATPWNSYPTFGARIVAVIPGPAGGTILLMSIGGGLCFRRRR